jgi:ribA/ribD-fused uncharacterized protein
MHVLIRLQRNADIEHPLVEFRPIKPKLLRGKDRMSEIIIIGKVKEEGGCWGNMAPFPIKLSKRWLTSEALFQAMRFDDEEIQEEIRNEKSPMGAKMIAKKHKDMMLVEPMSDEDLDNMRVVLNLKLKQHPKLRDKLIQSGEALIVEDCTRRQRGSGLFWGAAMIDGKWVGKNYLGKLWMELREELAGRSNISSEGNEIRKLQLAAA